MVLSMRPQSLRSARGFTLIEVLVVILIIGVLAAIALPSFLSQKTKAYDASAQELARGAQIAAETIATDNGGSYSSVSPSSVQAKDATIPTTAGNGNAFISAASGSSSGYSVTATSAASETFTITRASNGALTRSCAPARAGGCNAANSW